jgi:hypothetical protein
MNRAVAQTVGIERFSNKRRGENVFYIKNRKGGILWLLVQIARLFS